MTNGLTIKRPFRVGRAHRGRKVVSKATCQMRAPAPVPRVSRLMALAIRFDQLIRDGVVADQAELARLGYVSRARVTQIMNLLNLAPDIQEELLWLSSGRQRYDVLSERQLRAIVKHVSWAKQKRVLATLR